MKTAVYLKKNKNNHYEKDAYFSFVALSFTYCIAQQNDWTNVEHVFGKEGAVVGDVFKITYPRSDLKVVIEDFSIAPRLHLEVIQKSDERNTRS
jgi:hypothetical protein